MSELLKKIGRYAGKRVGIARYRMGRSLGWSKPGSSPVYLLSRYFSARYLRVMDSLWRLAETAPVRAVVPESIRGALADLAAKTGQRNLSCLSFDALSERPAPAFDAIVMMGELVQRMPVETARKVMTDWKLVHVSEPLIVLVDPVAAVGAGVVADESPCLAREGLRRVLAELEDLTARNMITPGPFGAQLECRYNLFDIEAVREVEHVYFKHVNVRPTDVIVDIGAHLGGFAVPCGIQSSGGTSGGKSGGGGKVLAYEPCPDNFALLMRNIERNCPGKVKALPIAVYKNRCKLPLQLDPTHSTGHGLFGTRSTGQATLVECVGLADVVEEAGGAIDVLKLDAEGAEYDFLLGQGDLLRKSVRTIIAEAHRKDGLDGHDLIRFLEGIGYQWKQEGTLDSMIVYAHR